MVSVDETVYKSDIVWNCQQVGDNLWAVWSHPDSHFLINVVFPACIVTEKGTGKSRGFGYVTFANKQDAEEAIKAIDGLVSCVTFEILSEMFTTL